MLTNQTYHEILYNNTTLESVFFNINEKISNLKIYRYLINYNFLHNKSLKAAHKLTMVKKLFTTGFFNSELIEKNL
jgi:hypothetical protein